MNDRRLVPQIQFSRGVEHLLTVVRLNTCQILIEAWNCALLMNGKATISGRKAENVGILATEVYFPASFVCQKDLEIHDGAAAGKYTIGLGQKTISFVGDREDAISMALTAVSSLLEAFSISHMEVGRLEVATESGLDLSKGIKSHLMQLFETSGNYEIEGGDCIAACYGGTLAVLNAVNWVESRSWDGRLAIVVASDISVYSPGPARPTSGAGAVALLIGPNAPLVLQPHLTSTHMRHAYDFYKPSGPYPAVDGPLSVYSYLSALDACFSRFKRKWQVAYRQRLNLENDIHFYAFHSPYNKLLVKAHSRVLYVDGLLDKNENPIEPQLMPRELEKTLIQAAEKEYKCRVHASTAIQRFTGNMYTASVWSGVAALMKEEGSNLEGKNILVYSYGSGLSSSLLTFAGKKVDNKFALALNTSDVQKRLSSRRRASCQEFEAALKLAEKRHGACGFTPVMPDIEILQPGTYYLAKVDEKFRRIYCRK